MSSIEVVGLGAMNIDHIYQVERLTGDREIVERTPGHGYEDSELKRSDICPGGSAANTIYGLARLGVKTGFVGAIGNDDDGKTLLRDFQEAGVDTSQIRVKAGAKTGLATCLSDNLNFRSIRVTPGANSLLALDDIDMDYINQADMLHISSFADDAQLEMILGLVNKLDSSVKISFSPGELYATKGIESLTPILCRTYVLFINEKEIKQLTGKDFADGAEICLEQGCHIVAVTLGKGVIYKTGMATSYIRDAKGEYAIEAVNKDVAPASDTTGAGDAFATGFLYGLLNRKELEECGHLGDIVARFCISKIGAREGLPTLAELTQRYQDLYGKEL